MSEALPFADHGENMCTKIVLNVRNNFCAGTKVFEGALNALKCLGWLKTFGPAQNILGPVKGQGIRVCIGFHVLKKVHQADTNENCEK